MKLVGSEIGAVGVATTCRTVYRRIYNSNRWFVLYIMHLGLDNNFLMITAQLWEHAFSFQICFRHDKWDCRSHVDALTSFIRTDSWKHPYRARRRHSRCFGIPSLTQIWTYDQGCIVNIWHGQLRPLAATEVSCLIYHCVWLAYPCPRAKVCRNCQGYIRYSR